MSRLGRRLLALLGIVLLVHATTFFLVRATRGGPFDAERTLPAAVEQSLRATYHLDEPWIQQYGRAVWGLFQGDLGPSMRYRDQDVAGILGQALPLSLGLGLGALAVALLLGLPAGIYSGLRRGRAADHGLRLLASLTLATPSFVLAGLLIACFTFSLGWLPPAGLGSWRHLILPCLALGLPVAAEITRLARSSTLEALAHPSVRAAQARGLTSQLLLRRHLLPRILHPVVAHLGPATAGLLTGSLVVEQVFALPGLGAHFVQAALNRDYTLATGTTVLYTLFLGLLTLTTDLILQRLNPQSEALS